MRLFLNYLFYFCLILFNLINAKTTKRANNRVILISFDGLASNQFEKFLLDHPNSNFKKIINRGVSGQLIPSFPSATFPNHITIVTGLYPQHHGIVNNVIYDPKYQQKVQLYKAEEEQWWNSSDPIWLTARQAGLKTASSFWISNNIWKRTPDIFLVYNEIYKPNDRVDELVSWIRKFDLDFATIYFDEPDNFGHIYGPESEEYRKKILEMDQTLGHLVESLNTYDLMDTTNLVIVSDHGMVTLKQNQSIFLGDYMDIGLIDLNKSIFSQVSNLHPKSDQELNQVYEKMLKIPNVKVYTKSNIPKEYNYNQNDRIGQLIVVADEGYTLTSTKNASTKKGGHGYNNTAESMRTVFMARGPNFRSNISLTSFENVNVYSLLCKLLNIEPRPNNGSFEIFKSVYIPNISSSSSSILVNYSRFYCLSFVIVYLVFYFSS